MYPLAGRFALIGAVAGVLAGCVKGDYASVTISYRASNRADAWSIEPTARQNIVKAFNDIAPTSGFKCRPNVKRVEEITCRGPKGLHMTFKPELNRHAFVAKFNWVASPERPRHEFDEHVAGFASSMAAAVQDIEVSTSRGES